MATLSSRRAARDLLCTLPKPNRNPSSRLPTREHFVTTRFQPSSAPAFAATATSRIRLWPLSGWECSGRRLSTREKIFVGSESASTGDHPAPHVSGQCSTGYALARRGGVLTALAGPIAFDRCGNPDVRKALRKQKIENESGIAFLGLLLAHRTGANPCGVSSRRFVAELSESNRRPYPMFFQVKENGSRVGIRAFGPDP